MPRNILPKVLYIALVVLAVLLLCASIGATIWSYSSSEDGWVTIAAFMVFSWLVSSPFILGAAIWTIMLATRKRNTSVSS